MLPIAWFLKAGLGQRAAGFASWIVPLALIAAAGVFLWGRGEHYRAEAVEARAETKAAESALKSQQVAFRLAYAASIAEHTRLAREAERAGQVNKEKADHAYIEGMEAGRDAAARYLATHRLRPQADRHDPGNPGGTNLPGPGPAPGEPAWPGGNAELVAITVDDFGRCTAAAIRLENAASWAKDYPGDSTLGNPTNPASVTPPR